MKKVFNQLWWNEVVERALKSAAQFALAGIAGAIYLADVQWYNVFSTAAIGFILSILTSVATLPEKEAHIVSDTKGTNENEL